MNWPPCGASCAHSWICKFAIHADAGAHRSAGPVDLLIAATAERERLTVLCDDRDYQTVATVTGQPVKLVTDV
jgi:predicted nucleic acid-binding protein